ncbi:MAG: PHP domain-containing protein, partial [Lachnospiraceae bacterium]|nr:PHP domain-containing protein [Lachnospiraceae bacterium]
MKYAVDLHMHSCLSPCGDMDMTPNNIVNMCKLKGLDMIAVTDHNTAKQLPVIQKVADYVGVALLPGMELTTKEEAHMLAYFRTVEEAVDFSDYIYTHLPPIKNKPKLFGVQAYMDEDDEIIAEEERLLITALDLSIDELFGEITNRGGLAIPAHINRGTNG